MARCLSVASVVALVLAFGWQTSATGVIQGPYTVQVLSDMTVSWTIDDTEANITATASGSVWAAVGFNTSPQMIGTNAAIGTSATGVKWYNLLSKSVNPTPTGVVAGATFTQQSSTTVLTFTRAVSKSPAITTSGNTMAFAHGSSQALAYHQANRGTVFVNMYSGETNAAASISSSFAMLAAAFAVLCLRLSSAW